MLVTAAPTCSFFQRVGYRLPTTGKFGSCVLWSKKRHGFPDFGAFSLSNSMGRGIQILYVLTAPARSLCVLSDILQVCDKCIGRPSSGHYDRHIIFVLLGGSNSLTFPIFLIYNSHPPCLLILTCFGLGFAKIIGYLVRFD